MTIKSDQDNSPCKDNCPCMDCCPLGSALSQIGGKWKIPILCALFQDGTTRFNELKRKIRGITNTMLVSSLKELEEEGLIFREQFMEMPVRVEYSVTDNCRDLMPILKQLAYWGAQVHTIK
ncbi:MAG: transcriptional regulator [Firmicutes bacterium HGW-Firmicutes-20]|uniref:DNA-binding transcriptional regulator, HxlR family n=1 Tax=Eubacterium aggregans TaxID=81409 RepID=A0A1H4EJS4_9FIRM|nr:helix-turn-helix domain-containing protein [Eubacterium aggregans]MDD3269668.1 helix-turn-helix domain-containing protein [Syntrophomonadaceae bacterium]PKM54953.1 MAG: transcriptional regulator [Firmicutes bacterium HGW-Firmicutes-5]PKM64946.1 MAG: transcriptional regulator [Firmicutes bacterium HGW-Firmicutes-20]SEA85304.1 DNA-binding transcriptional regulator, HxlR family [Eubacterium aggregans]